MSSTTAEATERAVDAAMTAIVNAPDVEAARVVCADLPARVLRGLADLMHLPTGGRRDTLTARVIAEARG